MRSLGRRVTNVNRMIGTTAAPAGSVPAAVPGAVSTQPELETEHPKSTEESLLKTKQVPPEERLQYRQPSQQQLEQVHEGEPPKPIVTPAESAVERSAAVPEGAHPPTISAPQPTAQPLRTTGSAREDVFTMGTREERDRLVWETVAGAGQVEPALLLQAEEVEIWVIAGAEGSLGLQFVKQALEAGNAVVAVCMGVENIEQTYELRELVSRYSTRSCIISCDFSNADKMLAAAIELKRVCGSHAIDVFINAGGIAYDGTRDIMKCTAQEMMRAFDLEVIGPLYFLQNILPNMSNAENPRAVLLSSIVGSNFNVQRDYRSTAAPYCIAKAAVNMLVTCFRAELEQAEVTVTSLHPGWASTKEGITPETNKDPPSALVDSVRKCMRTISHLDHERHGLFIDYQGSQLRY